MDLLLNHAVCKSNNLSSEQTESAVNEVIDYLMKIGFVTGCDTPQLAVDSAKPELFSGTRSARIGEAKCGRSLDGSPTFKDFGLVEAVRAGAA